MEKETKKSNNTKGIIAGVAIGAVAGAIAGILFAPKSGKETRADIAKYLHEIKEKIARELPKIGKLTKDKYEKVVVKVVNIYKSTKKISAKDAKEIKNMLIKNYLAVKRAYLKDK